MTVYWTNLTPFAYAFICAAACHNNNDHFTALCRDYPGELVPEVNIHPPNILIIIQSLSAFSIYHDP